MFLLWQIWGKRIVQLIPTGSCKGPENVILGSGFVFRKRPCKSGRGSVCCSKLVRPKMDDFFFCWLFSVWQPCEGSAGGSLSTCVWLWELVCVCTAHVWLKAALWSLWMLSVPISNWAPLVWRLLFCSFLAQKGPSDLELVPEEYSVMIGSYPCNISFNNDQLFHCTINGLLSSSERELPVTVSMRACLHHKTEQKTQIPHSGLLLNGPRLRTSPICHTPFSWPPDDLWCSLKQGLCSKSNASLSIL